MNDISVVPVTSIVNVGASGGLLQGATVSLDAAGIPVTLTVPTLLAPTILPSNAPALLNPSIGIDGVGTVSAAVGLSGVSASIDALSLASASICLGLDQPADCDLSTATATSVDSGATAVGATPTITLPATLGVPATPTDLVGVTAAGNLLGDGLSASVDVASLASVSLCLALNQGADCTPSTAIVPASEAAALLATSIGVDGVATVTVAAGLGGVTATADILGIVPASICLGLGQAADCSAPALMATDGANPVIVVPTGVVSAAAGLVTDVVGVVSSAAGLVTSALGSTNTLLSVGADLTDLPALGASATVDAAGLASASVCIGLGLDASCNPTATANGDGLALPTSNLLDPIVSGAVSQLSAILDSIPTTVAVDPALSTLISEVSSLVSAPVVTDNFLPGIVDGITRYVFRNTTLWLRDNCFVFRTEIGSDPSFSSALQPVATAADPLLSSIAAAVSAVVDPLVTASLGVGILPSATGSVDNILTAGVDVPLLTSIGKWWTFSQG